VVLAAAVPTQAEAARRRLAAGDRMTGAVVDLFFQPAARRVYTAGHWPDASLIRVIFIG